MIRTYGTEPYRVAVLHGGPGAMGSVACVARELSKVVGVVEPIQSQHSITALIDELQEQISSVASEPLTLIGHSWGEWLAILYAVRYSEFIREIVLLGCPPFEERFVPEITQRRLAKLTPCDAALFQSLLSELHDSGHGDHNAAMTKISGLVEKTDNVDVFFPDMDQEDLLPADGEMYTAIWPEAATMRHDGKLMECLRKVVRPVYVIHGDSDPHPLSGIVEPLRAANVPFEQYVLANCGHSPFKERRACREFYNLLERIVLCCTDIGKRT